MMRKVLSVFRRPVLPKRIINHEYRQKITEVENKIAAASGAMFGNFCPLKHSFAEGLYIREIFMPKGTLLVSRLHKNSYPSFILKGEVSMLTEEGMSHVKAPCYIISPAGTKRVLYMIEDTTWVTVDANPDNDVNVEKLERGLICESYAEFDKLPLSDMTKNLFLTGAKS
jgi:hypothetical protein